MAADVIANDSREDDATDDVVVLAPNYALKQKIGPGVSITELLRPEVLQQAQMVISQSRQDFVTLIKEDVALLQTLLKKLEDTSWDAEVLKEFIHTALQVKSRAGTFGYPLASEIARKLYVFCEENYRAKTDHMLVIRKHVEGLMVVMSQKIEGDGGPLGKELILSLDKLVTKLK